MNGWAAVGLAIAGGVGATLRHVLDTLLTPRARGRFPLGILIVNLTGSFALGLVLGLALDHPVAVVLGTGLLGGYTTFSTASLDTVRLLEQRRFGAAAINGIGMLAGAAICALAGILLARAFAG